MTKKDYELIAMAFRYAQTFGGDKLYTLNAMAQYLAGKLQQDNPRFNQEKFFEACGLVEK